MKSKNLSRVSLMSGLALLVASVSGCSNLSKPVINNPVQEVKEERGYSQEITLSFNGRDFYNMTPETCFAFYAFMDRVTEIRRSKGNEISLADYTCCLEAFATQSTGYDAESKSSVRRVDIAAVKAAYGRATGDLVNQSEIVSAYIQIPEPSQDKKDPETLAGPSLK